MKIKYIFLLALLIGVSGCEDYLDRKNLDTLDDANFWTSEGNMRLFAQGAYLEYFNGYGAGFAGGSFFTFGPWADEWAADNPWAANTSTSSTAWTFSWVRRANLMYERVDEMPVSDEAKNHWKGIARFFRAMAYSKLAQQFGNVPWFDREVFPQEVELSYKDRDPLPFVATKIAEDFEYAAANVRTDDGVQQINRDVVLGMMSRNLLYFGTFLKYHNVDQTASVALLEKAKWAAQEIIQGGQYQVADDYRALFASADLSSNKEVIFFRQYETAKATHSLVSYNNVHDFQKGMTLKMFETYLTASDGLPIKQSPDINYAADNGRRSFQELYENRDPRLAATIVDVPRLQGGGVSAYSTTGIATWKFLPYEANATDQIYLNSLNTTDAPVLRYGEVLLNYAEAAAELGTFTQADANMTINQLRQRDIRKNNEGGVLPKLPDMVVSGETVTANGVTIDDPDRDPTVSPLLWEIRRERAVELMFEGFRRDDLRRWKKLEYLNSRGAGAVPTKLAIGMWVDLSAYPAGIRDEIKAAAHFYNPDPGDTDRGYVLALYDENMTRDWKPGDLYFERQYLSSIPLDQIKLYKDLGYKLTQNFGWDTID